MRIGIPKIKINCADTPGKKLAWRKVFYFMYKIIG